MQKPTESAAPQELEDKAEQPEKTEVELDLAELDKVSGGLNFAAPARTTAAVSPAVGVYQIVPITPEGEGAQVPAVPGVSQIEAI